MRTVKSPVVAAIAAAALTASVVGGVAMAQTGTPVVITACVAENSGNARIVADADDCKPNENAVAWNQEGPQGPVGPTGLPGPAGADGLPGPAGPALFVEALQGGDYTTTPGRGFPGCTREAAWAECAPVTVRVPANKTYLVTIDSAGSYFAFNRFTRVRVCTSTRASTAAFDTSNPNTPSSCRNQPTGITLDNEIGNVATNGVQRLSGGSSGTDYVVSTAVRPDDGVDWYNGFNNTVVHTLVTVADIT